MWRAGARQQGRRLGKDAAALVVLQHLEGLLQVSELLGDGRRHYRRWWYGISTNQRVNEFDYQSHGDGLLVWMVMSE